MRKYPVLYESTARNFDNNGIGVLTDAIQCEVTEEINGIFELFMVYPINGAYFNELQNGRIINAAASNLYDSPTAFYINEPFRIVHISKAMNGLVSVYANHISYDLNGIILPPFNGTGFGYPETKDPPVDTAITAIKRYSTSENPFDFSSGVIDPYTLMTSTTPRSVRNYLLGDKDSVVSTVGGEFLFKNFTVTHIYGRGRYNARPVLNIRYGVNLIDALQEESIEKMYTGIYPYYSDKTKYVDITEEWDAGNIINRSGFGELELNDILPRKIIRFPGTYNHERILPVDLTSAFQNIPTTDEIREAAEAYIKENQLNVPDISLDIDFVELSRFPEYKEVERQGYVMLGDRISVEFVKLGIHAEARINTLVYDSLLHRTKRIYVGTPRNFITDTISKLQSNVKSLQTN